MHTRLALALVLTGLASVSMVRPAHAVYCTAADILELYYDGRSLAEIQGTCDALDVERCTVGQVFGMIDQGYSLPDIYYQCG